jgi:hypothetical protein
MDGRDLLRHLLATVAYRGNKAVRDAPPSFATFSTGGSVRTPVQILAHIGDLYDWALSIVRGQESWHDSRPLPWDEEVARFFAALQRFDDYLASDQPVASTPQRLLQGPLADSLAHIGQLTMLRRLSGARIKSENYSRADIRAGRVGADQTPPRREFD